MGNDWKKQILGDVIELKRGYDLPKIQRKIGRVPIISSAGISDFHLEAKVKGPGVVTGRYGTVGEVFFSESDFWPLNTTLYVRDFKGNDEKFVYYFLKTINYKQYSDKAAVPGVNRNHLHMAEIMFPPNIGQQKAIAHILGSLDDKIELNRQMNITLEAMAQALFKSWFVDFDPVIDNALAAGNPVPEPLLAGAESRKALGDQRKSLPDVLQQQFSERFVLTDEMGWIPDGWDVASLEEIIDLIGGGTPKTSIEEYWNGNIPWFSVVDAPDPSNVFVQKTEKYITEDGLQNSSAKLLPIGTTIISARGTVGKCALVGQPMAMNQSCYGIQGKPGISDYFVYYTVLLRVSELQQRGHGSVFNTITRETFRSIKTPICAKRLTTEFHRQIEPYFSRILKNNFQIECLSKLRDTLLPKLLSGELRVPEAEAIIDQQLAEA